MASSPTTSSRPSASASAPPPRACSARSTRSPGNPEHAITREEALRLYTVAGARFLGGQAGGRAGTLVPGAPADLAAYPADPFTCPGEQLAALSPAVTVIDGRLAYRAG